MNYKQQIKEVGELDKQLDNLKKEMTVLANAKQKRIEELMFEMDKTGVKRVEGENKMAVLATRKSMKVGNEVQFMASLTSNGITREQYSVPNKPMMMKIAKELISNDKDVAGLEEESKQYISFKDVK